MIHITTIAALISKVDVFEPNTLSKDIKVGFINELEGMLQTDVLLIAPKDCVQYTDYATDSAKKLVVSPPWDKIYWPFLQAMIQFAKRDYNNYANSMQLFNAVYDDWAKWYQRTHSLNREVCEGYYISAYGLALKHGFVGTEEDWLASLVGPQGEEGPAGPGLEFTWSGTQLGVRQEGASEYVWVDLAGANIASIAKTGTAGLVDTYTITYTSGQTFTFTVTNGNGIYDISKTGTAGLVDTYTITMDDGAQYTFTVTNGDKGDPGDTGATGVGISSIAKTSSVGLVDTYTITMTNGTTSTFTVTNGSSGQDVITAVGLLKGEGAGTVSAAVAGTDYQAPLVADTDYATPEALADKQDEITASGILKGDGDGGVSAAVSGTDYQAPLTAGTDYVEPPAQVTSGSSITLADNTEYVLTGVTTLTFAEPVGSYQAYGVITFDSSTPTVTLPAGATYIGATPTFAASETWEFSVWNNRWCWGKVS